LLRRLTFTVLLGDNDVHAKNLAILHLPGRSVLADVYDVIPSLFQDVRIDYNLDRHRWQLRPPPHQRYAPHP
jgi:serine/threonine-protein kinase HipA